ncbi:hypothetical protein F443_14852 [Phytophthora nicotianae P1569]|uniref:HAT C-terminal dimerisation domain-containing protein n=3 Tax=Phytophthora nicotianae TaxID=4792 RepID=V9EK22_PHYNI|nr:hypothetical protein F443_14852 [Phytophthora nicotianae P1569]
MALSEVDDPMTRALAAIKPVSSKTLVKYMRHVASKVGPRISTDMGNQFGLMFDGWTSEDLLPRPSTHRQIVQLVTNLEALDSVCVRLQSEEGNLADVRLLFDAVIAKFPATAHHLSPSTQIVHSPAFESAVVKLLSDRSLISDEEEAVAQFAGPTDSAQETPKKVDFATETLRHAKRPRLATVTKYIDLLRMIPPTSNKCERLFSQCKLVFNPLRSSMLPANFEMLVFLRANRELWDSPLW